jgi:hypothetical protein
MHPVPDCHISHARVVCDVTCLRPHAKYPKAKAPKPIHKCPGFLFWDTHVKVHPLYEPEYVIYRVANLTEEKSYVCISKFPTDVLRLEVCRK